MTGCVQSRDSLKIYQQIEEKHATITLFLYRVFKIALVFIYTATTLIPLCYAILADSTPHSSTLPLEIQ